ncbi:MAG: hypothetical protein HZB19_08535 [Chloroflexi bacterium]|nr:hypothetical protein [Chloroflexota bacterium]
MFRIGIMELGVTCVIVLLALVIPAVLVWSYKRIDQRLRNIENTLDKKSKE